MALCGSQNCGCAITSSTLNVTGSGTSGSPWAINLATAGEATIPQTFTNTTPRNSGLPFPNEGQMAWTITDTTLWVFDGVAWNPVAGGPTDLVTAGFTGGTGWTLVSTTGYRIGNLVSLAVVVQRTSSSFTVPVNSDVANTTIATAPVALRGAINVTQSLSSGPNGRVATGTYNPSTGAIVVTGIGGTGASGAADPIAAGDLISLGGTVIVE